MVAEIDCIFVTTTTSDEILIQVTKGEHLCEESDCLERFLTQSTVLQQQKYSSQQLISSPVHVKLGQGRWPS